MISALQRVPTPFYGWYIVATGMLVTLAAGPGQSFVFTVFIDPIIEDTGYTRTTITGIYAAGTVFSALCVFVVSRLSDLKGPRAMLIVIAAILGLVCLGLSMATGIIALAVALALLRGLGQGALRINATLLVSQWFIRHRGRAMAVFGLGGAMTIAIMPNLSQVLIEQFGWRGAYAILGLIIWGLVLPAAIFVVRNRPEDIDLFPDGARELPADEVRRARLANSGMQRRVLTSLSFWSLAIPLALPPLIDSALIFHQVALFERQGLSAEVAARVFIPFAMASALTGLLAGFVVERTGPTRLFVATAGAFIVAILMLQFVNTAFLASIYGIVLGCAMGMQQIGMRYTWPYYYGRYGLGQVQGSAMMVMISATALGPVGFAAVSAGIGYQATFIGMGGLLILAGILRVNYKGSPA